MNIALIKILMITRLSQTAMLGGCSADPALKVGAGPTGRFGDGTGDAPGVAEPGGAPAEVPVTVTPESAGSTTAFLSTPLSSTAVATTAADAPKTDQSEGNQGTTRTGLGLEVSCGSLSPQGAEGPRRLECSLQPIIHDPSTTVDKSARLILRQFSFRACPTSRVEEILSPPRVPIPSIHFTIDEGYIVACLTAFKDLTIADPATSALIGL